RNFNHENSMLGALFTAANRKLDDPALQASLRSNAYMAGFDFNQSWKDRTWSLDGFLTGSEVTGDRRAIAATQLSSAHYFQRPDATHVHFDPNRTSLSGYQGAVSFAKNNGEHWQGSITSQFMS